MSDEFTEVDAALIFALGAADAITDPLAAANRVFGLTSLEFRMMAAALGENRSSGSIIKNAAVEIPKTKEKKPVKGALDEKKTGAKPQSGLWLLIRSTRQL